MRTGPININGTVESSNSSSSTTDKSSSLEQSTTAESPAAAPNTSPPDASPFLPTAIPNTNININNNGMEEKEAVALPGDGKEVEVELEESSTPMKGKEHRELDSDIASELISAGQPQGRAFTNFVTVAPSPSKAVKEALMNFDLSDVSLGEEDRQVESQSTQPEEKEVTCSHEGASFKVRQVDGTIYSAVVVENWREDVLLETQIDTQQQQFKMKMLWEVGKHMKISIEDYFKRFRGLF